MELKNLMISISGVRGIVGDGLTPEVAMHFAQAYGNEFGPGRIVVGRDSRTSGEMIKHAVWAGLTAVGCDVVDIGLAPTPTTAMATQRDENQGGIIITASHNPKEWNALKLLAADGLFLSPEQGERVLERVKRQDYRFASWAQIGKIVSYPAAIEDHINDTLKLELIDCEKIRKRKFKIVADPCNGAGGVILPQLFEKLGCEVIFLNLEPHGRFPRSPEPLPNNLVELCTEVKSHHADLGIAVDPDVDRLAVVSERGVPLGEEYTLALVTDFVLSHTKGDVVVNASTSRVIDDIASKYGVPVHRTKVGEIHVAMRAREIGAAIAGEGNGGIIYPALHLGRDAIVGIAMILQLLTERRLTLSQAFEMLPQYVMIKDKISLPFGIDAKQLVQQYADKRSNEVMDLTDGLKFVYERSWVQLRASNTEPIIRIMAEAPTEQEAMELAEKVKGDFVKILP